MNKCQECGVSIADNYKYCIDCNNKLKQSGNEEIVRALGAINNNLYAIRRQQEVMLRESYKTKIVWSKSKKDFTEVKTNGN